MIKFGVRDFVASKNPLVIDDRIVAYNEYNVELPFDTDTSSWIGQPVLVFVYTKEGHERERYKAILHKCEAVHHPEYGWTTWKIEVERISTILRDIDDIRKQL